MKFGEAIDLLTAPVATAPYPSGRPRSRRRARRVGWNGKGMYIFLAACEVADRAAYFTETESDGALRTRDFHMHARLALCMRAADGDLVIGWLASQTDMLATDWEIVS